MILYRLARGLQKRKRWLKGVGFKRNRTRQATKGMFKSKGKTHEGMDQENLTMIWDHRMLGGRGFWR